MHVITNCKGKYRLRSVQTGFRMTEDDISAFLRSLKANGRSAGTIEEYKNSLHTLSSFLPADKQIGPDTLRQWRQSMIDRYSIRTINARISAANSFLLFYGRRGLTLSGQLKAADGPQPELTRKEYLRLLQAAKLLRKERLYLLIKLFACTGIAVKDIGKVTVAAVRSGTIQTDGKNGLIRLPACLQKEILAYAEHSGLQDAGFVTRRGKPLRRTNITDMIRSLCSTAQVAEEKGNPRCLRKLYARTQEGIRQNIETLAEQAYLRLLEQEQNVAGWE